MKKTRLSTILLLVLTLLCSIFVLASCDGGSDKNNGTPTPTKLTAPTVVLTDDTATWSADTSADKFEISVDGNLSYIENSVTSKKLSDGQTFKIRAIGDGTNYTNSDWSNSVTYEKPISKYTITWKNGDTVLETDTEVIEGTVPTYDGSEPTKTADAQYSYVFAGWTPEVVATSGDITYTAVFTSVLNKYTVTWKNGDNTLEADENVTYGSTPSYDGATPTKDATAQYTYTFSGWTPQINSVTGSVTYQAQFTEALRTYTVTFYSEDGSTVLDTVTVEYGSNAVYSKSTPVKNATAGHTYVFEKWVTSQGGSVADDLTNVIGDRSVYASFKEFVRTVTVYIVSNNTDYGTVSVSTLNNVPYGATITVNGNTITVNGQSVTANANTAIAQYTYTFANWTADATVGNDTIITANFSRSVNSYTVTWKNGNDTLETDENVAYGTTPVYNGAQPTKESDNDNIYTFSGWSPAISSVTGDITYIAQFTTTANKHTIVFYDDDGVTELGRVVVGHGETAIYPNALPTKEPTAEITYTFEKWVTAKDGATEASFANITEDKSVYAKYSTTARTYVVTFCDYDGTTISQIDVAYGNDATAPGDPEREGYRFDGWDKTFSNITGELTVKATYVQQFTVEFLDYDNSVIDVQLIDYNGNATAPENPTRNNYRFTGWNTAFSNVVHDLTIKAEYIRQYKVTFLDYDETVLKEVTVDAGSTAVAPFTTTEERNAFVETELEGYTFDGWDKVFANVSSDLIVTATYKVKTYNVKFVMPDGTVIGEEQSVEHGFSAITPEYPEYYVEGRGGNTKIYAFTKWDREFNEITDDSIITAIYDSPFEKPVLIVEFSKLNSKQVILHIVNNSSELYALEFKIDYSMDSTENTGSVQIESVNINSAGIFVDVSEKADEDILNYVINKNEKEFSLTWANRYGEEFNHVDELITFNFSTSGTTLSKANFKIVDGCSAIIGTTESDMQKVTPVIIYQ